MKENSMLTPLVSCIIPTYKRNDTLLRAIYSVLNQTYRNIELLIVDDNNPNDMYSLQVQNVIKKIGDNRIRYLQQKKPINGAVARNFGVVNAKGEYIAFLDDDDEWKREKISLQLDCLSKLEQDYGAITCLTAYYKNNDIIGESKDFEEEKLQLKILERLVDFNTSTVLFDKKKLIESGIFNESLNRHQDLQLFISFLEKYKIKTMNKYLVKYHVDDGGNRPNTEQLIIIKNDFFSIVEFIIKKYPQKTQKDIFAAHYFEIIFSAARSGQINIMIEYLMKIGLNFSAYVNLFKRIKNRSR